MLSCCGLASLAPAKGTGGYSSGSHPQTPWDNYYIGKIDFKNLSPEAKGSAIYAAVIPDPEAYITKHARKGRRDALFHSGR